MERRLLGWPDDGPRLRLDHRRFAYAGKFVTSDTGVAVVTGDPASELESAGSAGSDTPGTPALSGESDETDAEDATSGRDGLEVAPRTEPPSDRTFVDPPGEVLAAVAFNADRTDETALWLRYVTVRRSRRGEGIGGRLCVFVCERARDRGYETIRIGVNNPFSYDALYKAGFAFTGRETGIAELVLERPAAVPAPRDPERYRAGLDVFRERELSNEETAFLDRVSDRGPPALITDCVGQ